MKKRITTTVIALVLVFAFVSAFAVEGFNVLFLDVGQGDAALVMCGDEVMLIDGGGSGCSSYLYSLLKNTLGIDHLDVVIATHPHEDHIGGIPGALNACSVSMLYSPVTEYYSKCFNSMLKYAAQYGVEPTIPTVGETITVGSATVEFLSPNQNLLWASDADVNDLSIVVRITYCDTVFLFMGDAEWRGERCAMKSGDISADVLKVGHHGSQYSSDEIFLNAVSPEYAIISVGAFNKYNLPNDETLDRLDAVGAKVYRTDEDGTIGCTSDGQTVTVYTGTDVLSQMGLATPAPTATPEPTATVQPTATPAPTEDPAADHVTYIANSNSKKFHHTTRDSAGDISPSNRVEYNGSRDSLIADGYVPCKRCNP